ncbi:hypothetical protein GGF31_002888 [Allomyces arbusculus]|nr:hypothetical protein GGF31_002888 [Allomyces arbusculus]
MFRSLAPRALSTAVRALHTTPAAPTMGTLISPTLRAAQAGAARRPVRSAMAGVSKLNLPLVSSHATGKLVAPPAVPRPVRPMSSVAAAKPL